MPLPEETIHRATQRRPLAQQRDTDYHPNLPRWRAEAPCASYPNLITSDTAEERQEAMQICEYCPVRVPCALAAIDGHEEFHVWGGVDLSSATRADGGKALARVAGLVTRPTGRTNWTGEEVALLDVYSDRIVGWLTGRTTSTVHTMRKKQERKNKQ